jgi:hypothetical protein
VTPQSVLIEMRSGIIRWWRTTAKDSQKILATLNSSGEPLGVSIRGIKNA